MSKNPDIYLLYEYMEKVPFTVRMNGEAPYAVHAENQAAMSAQCF